ncbi:MAG: pantoate--beta-alanine ligase [Verrucomicrobia bacterium]|nr:pantoate--beta-alanine ligase [Verrucomicrobiota bacterium]
MRIITSIAAMQKLARRWQRESVRISFVPTMGYLHVGHLGLIKRARQRVGKSGKVVLSIYVNPTQFGPKEDLNRYPRDLARDTRLCRAEGVDLMFVPDDKQMYPPDRGEKFSTFVVEEDLSKVMEGKSRPTHFRGVTTVVAKLFNIVQPDVAVFGAKDFQQATIIRRLVRDLNFPVRIVIAPIARETDGVAMSSRNNYLAPGERRQATILWRAIGLARQTVRAGAVSSTRLKAQLKRLISSQPAARLDYVEVFEPDTLQPVTQATRGTHLALAVFVGRTRLIDNARL